MTANAASLRHRTKVAVLWSGLGIYGSGALRFAALLALGWILPPSDFGLLALATIVVSITESVGELGLTAALIQRREASDSDCDTVFWCNLAVLMALAVATVVWAEGVTAFLGNLQAAQLLRVLSVTFVITAFTAVPRAILVRTMRFRRISQGLLAGELGFAGVGVTMAALGCGVWSLAAALLAHRFVNCLYLWFSVEWRPQRRFDHQQIRKLLRFGGPFTASAIVGRALMNVDYFVIGRFLGVEALGYYSLAYQLTLVPLERFAGVSGRVAFAAFSSVQDQNRRMRRGLMEGLLHLYTITLPVVLGVVVLGPLFLQALYLDKWDPSLIPLQILGLSGLFLVPRLIEMALLALGKPMLRLWLALLRLAIFVLLVPIIGLPHGIVGIALCVALSLLVWAITTLALGARVLGFSASDVATSLWPATRAGLIAVAPSTLLLFDPSIRNSPLLALAFCGTTMALIYTALTLGSFRTLLQRKPTEEDPTGEPKERGGQ